MAVSAFSVLCRRAVITAGLAVTLGAAGAPVGTPAYAQAGQAGATPGLTDDRAVDVYSRNLIFGDREEQRAAIEALRDRGHPDAAAALVLALRYARADHGALNEALAAVTGHSAEGWFEWMLWQQAHPEIEPHQSFESVKLAVLDAIDPDFRRFVDVGQQREIRLEEIVWGGVAVDGIPALVNPARIAAEEADYLTPDEQVFGIEINGDARAYPLRILDWHEMFNDIVGGVPVSLAYCTLCGAGILFETEVEGREEPFTFGSTGLLYRSNKLMYDHQTDSVWNQFTGRPVIGPLRGSGIELEILPVAITTWADWRAAHPDTTVLSLDTGHERDYRPGAAYSAYFASEELMFPALNDDRAAVKRQIFGIRAPGGAKAWPLEIFNGGAVINDSVGLLDVVLVGRGETRTVRAYERGDHAFAAGADEKELRSADGASWRITEAALVGPNGQRLRRVPGHVAYWFAWAGYLGDEAELAAVRR